MVFQRKIPSSEDISVFLCHLSYKQLKCMEHNDIATKVLFRLQFHSDSIEGSVSVYGKYQLDKAFAGSEIFYLLVLFIPTNFLMKDYIYPLSNLKATFKERLLNVSEMFYCAETKKKRPYDNKV